MNIGLNKLYNKMEDKQFVEQIGGDRKMKKFV